MTSKNDWLYVNVDGLKVTQSSREHYTSTSYSCDDALDHAGFSKFNIRTIFACFVTFAILHLIEFQPAIQSRLAQCEFSLMDIERAALSSSLYLGIGIGGIFSGTVVDWIGNKKAIIFGYISLIGFSAVYCLLPWYWSLVICEFLVGAFYQVLSNIMTTCVELLPRSHRSYTMLLVCCVPFSGLATSGIALLTDGLHESRKVNVAARIPLALIALYIFYYFIPTSPRFLVASGRSIEAEKILHEIWKMNKVPPLEGKLTKYNQKDSNKSRVMGVFGKEFLVSTVMIAVLFLAEGCINGGVLFIGTDMTKICNFVTQFNASMGANSNQILNACMPLKNEEMWSVFLGSLAQVPMVLFGLFLANKFGRKKSLTMGFLMIFFW